MASNVLKVQKVSEPVVRSVELREMYDNSLNDLEDTWNDLGRLKSTLRSIGHRVDDAIDLRVPASSATASHIMPRKAKQLGEPLESLPHYRPRKVCRLDERYVDRDVSSPASVPLPGASAITSRHVMFKTSDVQNGSDAELWYHDASFDPDSKGSLNINLTDSRAERETQVRFLNDSVSPASRIASSGSGGYTEPFMAPWVRRVNVRVPKAPSPGDGSKEGGSAQAVFDTHYKLRTMKDTAEDDMSKLQETIRKQRAKGSQTSSYGSGEAQFANGTATVSVVDRFVNGLGHGATFGLQPPANDTVKARKVASLPAAKAYPGFSRPHQAPSPSTKQAAARAVSSRQAETAAAKPKSGTSSPRPVAECDPVAGGFQVSSSSAVAAQRSKITPSSWRAGVRLVRLELGPPAPLPASSAAAQRASGSNRSKASSPRPLSAPAARHKKDAQLQSPAVSSAPAPTAVSRRQATDTGLGQPTAALTTTTVVRAGSLPAPTAAAGAGVGELAASENVHKATISGLVEGVASGSVTLPDAAKDVLRELQSDTGEETCAVSRKIGWESADRRSADRAPTEKLLRVAVASGAGRRQSKDRGQTVHARAAASTPPPQKTRRYDAADIQKYMQRKKSEERRQRAAEVAAKKRAEEEHQRKLQELFMKQKGIHRLGSVSGRPHTPQNAVPSTTYGPAVATNNDTFTHDPYRVAVVDSDKENRGMGSGTPTSGSTPPSSRATPDHCTTAQGDATAVHEQVVSPPCSTLLTPAAPVLTAAAAAADDGSGLLSFADENLKRILNKYKTRRELEAHLFVPDASTVLQLQQRTSLHASEEPVGRLQPRAAVRSHIDRIASIKAATTLLAAKIHAAQAKLSDQCLSGQHESWQQPRLTKSPSELPLPELRDRGRTVTRAHVAPAGKTESPLFFVRTLPGAHGLPSRDYGARSWSYGGSGGHHESGSELENPAVWRTESVTNSSDGDRSQTLDSSGTNQDLAVSGETSGACADLRQNGNSAADGATSPSINPAGGGIADRIVRSLGQTAFCMASYHETEEHLISTRLRPHAQLSSQLSLAPQRATPGHTTFRSAMGVHQDLVHTAGSESPPKPCADYYSSINVHLRKSSTHEYDGTKVDIPKFPSGRHKAAPVSAAVHMSAVEAASLSSLRTRGDSTSRLVGDTAVAPIERAPSPELHNADFFISDMAGGGGGVAAGSFAPSVDSLHGVLSAITSCPGLPSDALDGHVGHDHAAVVGVEDASSAASSSHSRMSEPVCLNRELSPVPRAGASISTPDFVPDAGGSVSMEEVSGGMPQNALSHLRLRTGAAALLGASPLGLGFRMAAELNLLDSVEESVRALTDVEMTRHAAAAQQEAARLALLLEGTKHSHEHELRQLRARVRAEEEEAQRQLEAVRRQALTAAHERDAAVDEQRRTDSQSLALYNSTRQLVESQMEATRASVEATRYLAEAAAAAGRDEHMRRQEAAQIAAEAASLSAAAAVTATLDRQRQEQAEFFRLARQHVYDRSVQVSSPIRTGDDHVDTRYAASFDSPPCSSGESSASRIRGTDSTRKHAKASTYVPPSITHSPHGNANSSPSSGTSHASLVDSHSTATVVESDDVHTANVSTASVISSESDMTAAGGLQHPLEQSCAEEVSPKKVTVHRHHHSDIITVSENSVPTASSISNELERGRSGTALKHEHSASTIGTDSSPGAGARLSLQKYGSDLSASGSAIRTLSDVQAIIQRQTASDVAKKFASSSTASASILTTEAVRLHDRQTASEHRSFPREVRPGLDGDRSTVSDGSTIRSESGAYASHKATTRDAGDDDDYTQDFYETSNASADESGADVPTRDSKRKIAAHPSGPAESDKQRSPRAQKLAAQGEVVPTMTSADDTGKSHASRAAVGHGGAIGVHGGSNSSASHALAVIRQLIRDERLRALHEEQLARAKYRAICYKSKFELQTVTTQKEIAGLKGNAELLAELETRAAALADSFARKKAAIQSKLRSDRTYYKSRLDNLRERYVELAAAAKDLGAGGSVQLAELDTPLDDVDLSLSESSISSSAGELNADSITALGRDRQEGGRSSSNVTSSAGTLNMSAANVGKPKRMHRDWQDGTTLGDAHGQRPAPAQVLGEGDHSGDNIVTRDMAGTAAIAASPAPDWISTSQAGNSAQATGAGGVYRKVPDGATATRAAGQATRRRLLGQQQPAATALVAANAKPAARLVLHGDSESDESISMSMLEGGTGSESDTEGRIHALQYQLKQKQKEEARLKRLLTDADRERRRERKRNQETSLLKQLELTEENIARLNENLREVQRSAQQSAHPEDGADNVISQQLQQLRPGSSGSMVLAAAHEPAAQITASVTKPLIKQPRAALQQLSAAAVGPSAGPAAAAAASVFVQAVPSSSGLTLSVQAIPGDLTHSLPIADHEARVLALSSPHVQSEAVITESEAVVGISSDSRPVEQDLAIDDGRSTKVDLSSRDKGDSQALKGYTSDSFVDSYTSEEQGGNDDSKNESMPEEIPEVLDGDSSDWNIAHSEAEARSEPLSQPGATAVAREHILKPESVVATAADPDTELLLLREVGDMSSLADTVDSIGGYSKEPLSSRHHVPSESSSTADDNEDSALVLRLRTSHSLPGRDGQLEPVVSQPVDVRQHTAHQEPDVAHDMSAMPNQLQPKPVNVDQSASSESSIAEEDFPSSVSADSKTGLKQEADATSGMQYDAKPVDATVNLHDGMVEQVAEPMSSATGMLLETDADTSPAPASLLPLGSGNGDIYRPTSEDGYSDDRVLTDEYETEPFDSDPSVASIATPSAPIVSPLEVVAPPITRSPLESLSDRLLLESKPHSAAFAVTADTADVHRVAAEDVSARRVVSNDWRAGACESDDDASDKDASWSASDESKLQSTGDVASPLDKCDNEESVAHEAGVAPELCRESSINESLEEVVEQVPSDAETDCKGFSLPAGTEPVDALQLGSPTQVLLAAQQPKVAEAIPSNLSSGTTNIAASSDETRVNVVDRLADWLLTEALETYGRTRDSKLKAAGMLDTAVAVTADIPDLKSQASSTEEMAWNSLVTDAKFASLVPEPAVAQAPLSAPKSAQKEVSRGRGEAMQSPSTISLADLPPLVTKKASTTLEPTAAVVATSPSASEAAAVVASQPPTVPEVATAGETKSLRPLSPVLGSSGAAGSSSDPDDAWTKLDKEINSVFGDDVDWFDEDFGLGLSKKPPSASASASPVNSPVVSQQHPPPPPYPGTSEAVRQAGRVDPKGVPPPAPFSVIPDKQEDILALAFSAVDTFWQMRRFGESWDGAQPPDEYMASATGAVGGLEAASKSSNCRMIFDLVGEMLREIYREETDAEVQESWPNSRRLKLPSRRYWRGKTPPATIDELKKVVEQHIFKIIGCQPQVKNAAVGPRARKKDRVDGILIEELRQEEADWVNYVEDEDAVKEAVFKDIFNLLIVDTGKNISEGMRITKRYGD